MLQYNDYLQCDKTRIRVKLVDTTHDCANLSDICLAIHVLYLLISLQSVESTRPPVRRVLRFIFPAMNWPWRKPDNLF